MIRVLHILTTLDLGGAELQTLRLLERFPRSNFEFAAAWLKGPGELEDQYRTAGARTANLRLHDLADPGALRRALTLVRTFRPHVVHTHMMKADVIGALASRLAGVPVLISTKHNEDRYLRLPPLGLAASAVAGLADAVVVISDAVGRFFGRRLLLPEDRYVRIHHGLEGAGPPGRGTDAERHAFRRELGLPGNTPLVVTVARLARQKGLEELLRAAALLKDPLPDAVFLIAGRGDRAARLAARVRTLGLDGRVRFLGLRRDVPRLLRGADLFVLPSHWEGFGLVLLEAMHAALPIVATRVGAIPEIVVDGETGRLVPARDADTLATAILELLSRPDRSQAMGRAGRRRLVETFTLEKEAEAHRRLYEGCLAARRDQP